MFWLRKTLIPYSLAKSLVYFIISGGYGAGSYFVPVYVQHLLIFPLALMFLDKGSVSHTYKIVILFIVAICLEICCKMAGVSEGAYRLLYARYFFASVLGAWVVLYKPQFCYVLLLSIGSFIYIFVTSYFGYEMPFIYSYWMFQHAPAYFYTLLLIVVLWYAKRFSLLNMVTKIGKYSYHIFLVQMFYFWCFDHFVKRAAIWFIYVDYRVTYTLVNCILCIGGGMVFFKLNHLFYGLLGIGKSGYVRVTSV